MPRSLFSVSFLNASGNWEVSQYRSTLRAARSWAKFVASREWAVEVRIHRGGPGGEVVA